MSEPSQTFLSLLFLCLWTGVGGCDVQASLAPPVHLSGESQGTTLLVCVVTDQGAGHLEISWRSSRGHLAPPGVPYSLSGGPQDDGAVAIITVATSEWPSYSCLVTHRHHARVIRRHHISYTDRDHEASCYQRKYNMSDAIGWWTDHVTIQALRLLLMKTVIFNTLATAHALVPRPTTCGVCG